MDANRQDARVFQYVRDILSTQRRDTGVPVVFGLAKVSNATTHFTSYLRYLLTGAPEPRTGELKRAVREIFEETGNVTIGDGMVPKLEGGTLSSVQIAELACHVISLDEKIPATATLSAKGQWRATIMIWKQLFIEYNNKHGDLWGGFKRTVYAENGNPVLIYRMFLLASGITNDTRFDPARISDASLPHANGSDYERFKSAVDRDPDFLDADIRSKIWRGLLAERNPHYLAAGVPKPTRKPLSSASMLEMFACYFNRTPYTYDRPAYGFETGNVLKIFKTIASRYWHMIGSIAMGPLICIDTMIGGSALLLLLVLWRNQRHSAANGLDTVSHWSPHRTVVYALFCAFAGPSPLLALATAVPVAVFAAHLARKWDEIKAVA